MATSTAECIIGELRGIASIKFGEYWCNSLKTTQKANAFTSISRTVWYTHESRQATIAYIDSVLEKSFSLLHDAYTEGMDAHTIKKIKSAILNAQYGIINLKGIYHNDENIKSTITNIISTIKERYGYFNNEKQSYVPYKAPPIPEVPNQVLNFGEGNNVKDF